MRLHFGHLLGFIALFIAACAAFFSVYGIGMLFSGAMIAVIIMGSSLELGKLVAASYLQRYWNKTNWLLKTYLIAAIVVLMTITSGGIYGFLSSAYQETFQKLALSQNEISFLEQKKQFFADDVARYDKELERISANISELSTTKTNEIQIKDKTSSTGVRNVVSTSGMKLAQERIKSEEVNRETMMGKRSIAADSLQKYQLAILEKQNGDEISSELGPLLYISKLTNVPMDNVVNYFILIFIIVFDPLAVTLIIATNRVFAQEKIKRSGEAPTNTPTKTPKKSMLKRIGDLMKKKKTVKQPVTEPQVAESQVAEQPVAEPQVAEPVTQITTVKESGIKREDIKEIRENQQKNRNFTRNIPVKRGY